MPFGPGKYGANAEALLKKIQAHMVLVVVIGGPDGPAFDVATINPALLETIPRLLRQTAKDIEKTMRGNGRVV